MARMDYGRLPPVGAPRFLVPRSAPRTAALGLDFFAPGSDRSLARRATSRALSLGAGRLLPRPGEGDLRSLRALSAVIETAGYDDCAVVHLGHPRANRKPVAVVIAGDEPVAVVKLGTSELTDALIEHETAALRWLESRTMKVTRTARCLASGRVGDHSYLVQSVLPTRAQASDADASLITEFTAELNPESVPNRLGDSPWADQVTARLAAAPQGADRDLAAGLWEDWRRAHPRAEVRQGWWHGDLSPWNCCVSGGNLLVWDWERFGGDVLVGFDVANWAFRASMGSGVGALAAARATRARAHELLGRWYGGDEAALVAEAYFFELATRIVADRQRAAGGPAARLDEWLPQLLGPLPTSTRGTQ